MDRAIAADHLNRGFARLLAELAGHWPQADLDYVAEEVGYREYSDALENLIALGLRKDEGFSSSEADQIRAIAAIVEMKDSPFLQKLQAKAERETADLAAAK